MTTPFRNGVSRHRFAREQVGSFLQSPELQNCTLEIVQFSNRDTQPLLSFEEPVSEFDTGKMLEPHGSTPLADAILAAIDRLADRAEARKEIIVLSDGKDTSSRSSMTDVHRKLKDMSKNVGLTIGVDICLLTKLKRSAIKELTDAGNEAFSIVQVETENFDVARNEVHNFLLRTLEDISPETRKHLRKLSNLRTMELYKIDVNSFSTVPQKLMHVVDALFKPLVIISIFYLFWVIDHDRRNGDDADQKVIEYVEEEVRKVAQAVQSFVDNINGDQ